MIFEWDENKRQSNIVKHGFDFLDAWQLFAGDYIKIEAKIGRDGERRCLATGFVYGNYATVIYTERSGVTRIISLRKAGKNERKQYQALHDG